MSDNSSSQFHTDREDPPRTARKKDSTSKQSRGGSRKKGHRGHAGKVSSDEMDSYELFKEYKKRKKESGVKNLIKKVNSLERQVRVLENEKQQLEKMRIVSRGLSNRKQCGIASNLVNIKVSTETLIVKQDIISEVKRIREKVDHLGGKSNPSQDNAASRIQQRWEFIYSANMGESKVDSTSNLMLSKDRSKFAGKIVKKTEVKPQEHVENKPEMLTKQLKQQSAADEMIDLREKMVDISQIAEPKPRCAITITKDAQLAKPVLQSQHSHEETIENEPAIDNKKEEPNLQEMLMKESFPPPLEIHHFHSQIPKMESTEVKPQKTFRQNRDRRKILQHKQHCPQQQQPRQPHETRGFIRSGLRINNFNPNPSPKGVSEEEGSLKMLEFDTGKQKFVVDSRNTEEDLMRTSSKVTAKEVCSFQDSEGLMPNVPVITRFPTYDTPEQQLVEMGKKLFNQFGVDKINSDQTVLKVKKYKNCTYFGIDSQSNILLHYEGRVYFGGWREFMNGQGEKFGEGVEYQDGKFLYKGQFRDGKRNGRGVLKIINSQGKTSIYVGQFLDGLKHGEGKQFDENGVSYQGEWKEGRKDGFGKLVLGPGENYEGTFEKGLKSGHGMENFKNGDKYEGCYVEGKFEGRGRYNWSNGSVYEGDFREGMRNGKGIWRSSPIQGDTYEGQYLNDLKHGFGIYRWANGCSYEGHFQRDHKHGKGVLTHENGKVSKLEWENGVVVGKSEHSHSQSQFQHSVLSNTQIRNHSRSLPVNNRHVYAQKQAERPKPMPLTHQSASHLKSSSASNLPRGIPVNFGPVVDEKPRPEAFMRLYEMSERPMTSKSVSSATGNNFRIEQKKTRANDGLPKDPPYKAIRPSTNMINF